MDRHYQAEDSCEFATSVEKCCFRVVGFVMFLWTVCVLTVPSPSLWAVRSFTSSLKEVFSSFARRLPPLKKASVLSRSGRS